MAYIDEGTCLKAELVGGELLPLNMLPGLFEVGQLHVDSQGGRYFTSTDFTLKYHVGTLASYLVDNTSVNKTLVAIRWKADNGDIVYLDLQRTNEPWVLKVYIENSTQHQIITSTTNNLRQTLEYIGYHLGGGEHQFSGFLSLQVVRDDINPYIGGMWFALYAVEYQNRNPEVGEYHNAGYAVWGWFCANSEGEPNHVIAFNSFNGIPKVVPDNPTPSEPTENQNPEIEYRDDKIDFPTLPTDTALGTDFLRLYHLDSVGLTALAGELWDNNFFSNIIKNYDSPFENIISLNILPVSITGTNENIVIGNYDTNVTGGAITTQFVDLDGGSCRIDRLRDNQLDFEPARTLSIYIPFIGYRQIDLDDLTGGTAYLKYRLDLLTGNILAMLRIVLDRTSSGRYSHDSVEYFFNGNCATSIPVSGSNYAIQYSNMINGAMSASTGLLSGSLSGAVGGMSSINNSKPQYMRSGQLSGNVGFMGQMTAFMLLSSPVPHIPEHARELIGYRSMIYWGFDNLSGYTEVDTFHPSADLAKECTEEELEEIEKLLKGGVIF